MAAPESELKKISRSARPIVGVAFCVAVLMGLYQNCAPSGSLPGTTVSEGDQDHIVRALENQDGESVAVGDLANTQDARAITSKADLSVDRSRNSPEACSFTKLHCFRKIYSPDVDDAQGLETLCLDSNDPTSCLRVSTNSYNTRHSLSVCENCGPEASAPGGEYNREEFTCWMGDPNLPTTSAFALRSSFAEAVRATRELCGAQ